MVNLEIGHRTEGDYDLLAPRGEVDLSCYAELRDRINAVLAEGRAHLVLDLSETEFLDSTALGALISARRKAYAAGGSFAVICDNTQMLKLFRITKLDLVFTVHPSFEAWRDARDG